jgi:hypothetical protein
MSSFTTPLELSFNDRDPEKPFVVDSGFVFWTDIWPERNLSRLKSDEDGNCIIFVPSGYSTDFASIPRIVQNIFPPHHPHYAKAAVIHDYLYSYGIGTKRWADAIFLEGMKVLGCPAWKRFIFHTAARIGGRGAYV